MTDESSLVIVDKIPRTGVDWLAGRNKMQKDVQSGLAALFQFEFDHYHTIVMAKLAYKLAFGLTCLLVIGQIWAILAYVRDVLRWVDNGDLMLFAMLVLVVGGALFFLAMVRLSLEFFVLTLTGHQRAFGLQQAIGPPVAAHPGYASLTATTGVEAPPPLIRTSEPRKPLDLRLLWKR
jgi:hypothetical protein